MGKSKPALKKGHEKLMRGAAKKANAPAAKKTAAAEKEAAEKRARKAVTKKAKKPRPTQATFDGMDSEKVAALTDKGMELIEAVEDMKEATKRVHDVQIAIDALGDEHGFKPGERYYDRDSDVWVKFGKVSRQKPKAGTSASKATGDDIETEDTPIGAGTMAGRGAQGGEPVIQAASGEESEEGETVEELAGATH